MKTFFTLLLVTISCQWLETEGADCPTCKVGILFIQTGTGTPIKSFSNTSAEAIADKNSLEGTGFFTAQSSSAACAADFCGTNSTCTAYNITEDPSLTTCSCDAGYVENQDVAEFACDDLDECTSGVHNCSASAVCTNTDGSYTCNCHAGYSGDGVNCTEINECATSPCHAYATCTDAVNNYTCACNSRFTGDGYSNCTDIDECADESDNCHANANCANSVGSFSCACLTNYTGDGVTCTEIDECDTSPCDTNARCADGLGSFSCACNSGYTGTGVGNGSCSNIDDCSPSNCSTNADCSDGIGTYTCDCKTGFTGDAYTNCTDIDECLTNPCDANAECNNTQGSFTCVCDSANRWRGDGFTCYNRHDQTVSFNILCNSFPYVSNLGTVGSTEEKNLTDTLQNAIDVIVTGLDSLAKTNCSFTYSNTSNANETMTSVSCSVLNTTQTSVDLDKALTGLTENTVCGASASGDECTNGLASCSGTCLNTEFGYCCQQDFDYLGDIRLDDPYKITYNDSTTSDFEALWKDILGFSEQVLASIETRGCSPSYSINVSYVGNGSTIAVYTLQIKNATFTPADITAALKSSSVVNTPSGKPVMTVGGYDACADDFANKRDCSDFATCLNGNGSFSCHCNSSYYDNSTSLAGRICINPVIVSCDATSIQASVLSDYYTNQGISLTDLHLFDENCNRSSHASINGDTLQFNFTMTECNTNVTGNGSHIIVANEISNVWQMKPFTGTQIKVPVQCALASTSNTSFNFNGNIVTEELPPATAIGQFKVLYRLYNDSTYTHAEPLNKAYSSTDKLYARIYTENAIGSASINVKECWGTAYESESSTPSSTYINGSCPVSTVTGVTIRSNGNGDATFEHQAFFFPITQGIYLHCKVEVCAGACSGMPACSSRRRRRDAEDETAEKPQGTITLLIKQDPNDPIIPVNQITELIHTNNITITVIASILALVLIILLIIIVVFVVRKKRGQKETYELSHVNTHVIDKPPVYS